MFKLKHTTPQDAKGTIAETYASFPPAVGIPEPLLLLSASPGLFEQHSRFRQYFMDHSTLSGPFLAAIRYAVSQSVCYNQCSTFNAGLLKAMGMTDSDLEALKDATEQAPLDPSEAALLQLCVAGATAPESVTQAMVDDVRAQGWSDQDILDAMFHAANMVGYSRLHAALAK